MNFYFFKCLSYLFQNPDGIYSKLVHAQRFREQKADVSPYYLDEEDATLSESRLKMKKEQPQATEPQSIQMSTGQGSKKRGSSMPHLFARLLKLNVSSRWEYAVGVAGSTMSGMLYPVCVLTN